ncbi:MAG: hypothetical protein B7Z69_00645 [Actinobacteria bacterium 21-73-9]|nr:MAG: hypothetical protein B7Z69_00645 [Actinobacteria bacterium 21-73-9]
MEDRERGAHRGRAEGEAPGRARDGPGDESGGRAGALEGPVGLDPVGPHHRDPHAPPVGHRSRLVTSPP